MPDLYPHTKKKKIRIAKKIINSLISFNYSFQYRIIFYIIIKVTTRKIS